MDRSTYCRKCLYDLGGIGTPGLCPECGRPFDLADPKTFRTRRPRGIWRRLRWVVYPLLLIMLACAGGVGWLWWGWQREQPAIAWARAQVGRGDGGVGTKSIGPAWLQARAGRWGYLLERADRLVAGSQGPVTAAELPLSRLRHLTVLSLGGGGAGNDLMGEVGQLRELRGLALGNAAVTDDGLARLAACRYLDQLLLRGSRVGDQGLAPLADHPELAKLGLALTPVDDRAVPVLKRLTKLTYLDLTGTQVTPVGVAELKKALPGCTIAGP